MAILTLYAAVQPWGFADLEEGFDYFTEYKRNGSHNPKTNPVASAYTALPWHRSRSYPPVACLSYPTFSARNTTFFAASSHVSL